MASMGSEHEQWLEMEEYLEPEELDRVREVLVYILLKETSLEVNDACSLVFGRGETVTWH